MTLRIEHHPENGRAPWVVIARDSLWVAFETEDDARKNLNDPQLIGFDLGLSGSELQGFVKGFDKAVSQ